MFATIRNAWKIAELRKKLLFTLFILLIFRLGSVIPVPYVNSGILTGYFDQKLSDTILGLYNAMSGSAFSNAMVFALGIQPYINASIILQLLCIAIPALERLQKEGGEEGKKKIERITRYSTVGLGLLMGWAYYVMLSNANSSYVAQYPDQPGMWLMSSTGFMPGLVVVMAFAAGASLVMWLGEQIDHAGIGNGISMILFAGIVSRVPSQVVGMITDPINGVAPWYNSVLMAVGSLLLVVVIVFITNSERRIPVQYAKRMVGRKVYGGQSSFLPIKVNMSGVLPVIFAQSITSLPATVIAFVGTPEGGFWGWMNENVFSQTSIIYCIFYFLLIIFFSYFYASVQFNPVEISNNMKKNGGFIPGFRPGKPTSDFIKKVINKVTLFGAIYLAFVALFPVALGAIIGDSALSIGGTSVIIMVSVALETMRVLEAQMLMRHYKGFLD